MSQECVFCSRYQRGTAFGCCSTFICRECLSGEGFNRRGGGILGGASQAMCPSCAVWVDI
jgi:hypothetical protein